ncbi:hypothetical protein ACTXT7_012350 [Hymenolepis weldensis]
MEGKLVLSPHLLARLNQSGLPFRLLGGCGTVNSDLLAVHVDHCATGTVIYAKSDLLSAWLHFTLHSDRALLPNLTSAVGHSAHWVRADVSQTRDL